MQTGMNLEFRTRLKFLMMTMVVIGSVSVRESFADTETKAQVTGKGIGIVSSGPETNYLKGGKLRKDATERGKAITYVYDLDARMVHIVNHGTRQIENFGMEALAKEVDSRLLLDRLTVEVVRLETVREIALQKCQEYSVKLTVPTQKGKDEVMVKVMGSVWVAESAPDRQDYNAFWKKASAGAFFLGIPSHAKSAPGQVKLITTLYQKLVEVGVPYESNLTFAYEGENQASKLMQKLASQMHIVVAHTKNEAIKDELFNLPTGYAVIRSEK